MPTTEQRVRAMKCRRCHRRGFESCRNCKCLTATEQAHVVKWIPLVVNIALKSRRMQQADRDDAVGDAFLQAVKSIRTYRRLRGAIPTHLGDCVKWAMLRTLQQYAARGFGGLAKKPNLAAIEEAIPGFEGMPDDEQMPEASQEVDKAEVMDSIETLLAVLTDLERHCVIRRFLHSETYAIIGASIGKSSAMAQHIVKRAIQKMREDHTQKRSSDGPHHGQAGQGPREARPLATLDRQTHGMFGEHGLDDGSSG